MDSCPVSRYRVTFLRRNAGVGVAMRLFSYQSLMSVVTDTTNHENGMLGRFANRPYWTGDIFRVMTVVGLTQRSPFAGMTDGGITLAVFCEESRF